MVGKPRRASSDRYCQYTVMDSRGQFEFDSSLAASLSGSLTGAAQWHY